LALIGFAYLKVDATHGDTLVRLIRSDL